MASSGFDLTNLKNGLSNIANTIRKYNGTSQKYKFTEIPEGIASVYNTGHNMGYNTGYNKGVSDGSKKPYLLRITASCNQEYGTYNWSGSFTIEDALTGTRIYNASRGTFSFTYNGCSYTVNCNGDTVYGAYTPWISVSISDNTHGVSVCTMSEGTTRVIWNGSGYQSI